MRINYVMRIMHNYFQNTIILDHNLKLHKMIDMHLKYDYMHTNRIFNVLICINNHVNPYTNCMLSHYINTLGHDACAHGTCYIARAWGLRGPLLCLRGTTQEK